MYLEATRDGKYPIGIITSTVDKFIRGGTTTEYVTQEIGSHIDNKYARITSTSSREYYRLVQPTQVESGESRDLVQPTGLVLSSVSYKVDGSLTTEYHIEHYRTFLDGHYAHLMSSISKVYSDPPVIVATPVYRPDFEVRPEGEEKDGQKKNYLFPRENIRPAKPIEGDGLPTKTIGSKPFTLKSPKALRLDDIVDKESTHQRDSEVLENNIQVRSINQAIVLDPAPVAKEPETVPTFTVDEDGDFNIPTPSIVTEDNEIEPTSVANRFEKPTKTSLDSVTFVGFVDFTTTIDDTVVIFSPKKTFSTATRNFLVNKIQPTSQVEEILVSTTSLPVLDSSQPEKHRTSEPDDANLPKFTSGINPLKSLLSARNNKFSKPSVAASAQSSVVAATSASSIVNNRPKITLVPNPSLPQEAEQEDQAEEEVDVSPSTPDLPELSSSIDINSDVELVYKTLYTTYTYFTTFFRASTTRIKSREEVISNVVTLTNILDPSELASLRSSCEVDSTCHFVSSTLPAIFTTGFIGRPNTKEDFPEVPRSSQDKEEEDVITTKENEDSENSVYRTFYTTYTYFTTLFVDGTSSISTRTEVYSDVKSSGVPVSFLEPDSSLVIHSTEALQVLPSVLSTPSAGRLEYSSILRSNNDEVTTPDSVEETVVTTDSEPAAVTEESKVVFVDEKAEEEEKVTEEEKVKDDEKVEEKAKEEENITEVITPTSISDVEKEVEKEFENIIEEEEEQEATEKTTTDQVEIEPATPAQAKTFYTTYTYFTTLFRNGTSFVTSNLETVTNVADTTASPVLVQPSVTFFTTFTYWTTSIDGDNTVITSREETKTDILPASVTDQLNIQPSSAIKIEVTQTASFDGEIDNSTPSTWNGEETTTNVPELESGETEPSFGVQSSGNTVTPSLQPSSSVSFENLDDDFILSSSIVEDLPKDSSSALGSAQRSSRSRLTFTKPSRSLTPAIRPNLFKTRARPNIRARGSTLTTVALITRSDITPTLIATPASTQIPATPTLDIASSSALKSAGFSRGGNRFSSSRDVSGTIISASPSSSAAAAVKSSAAIDPSAVESDSNTPSILSGVSLRRPNPFQARLKERQRQRLQNLRDGSDKEEKEEKNDFPINIPSSPPGGNAPIFISSKTEKISAKNKAAESEDILEESTIDLPENVREQREKARSRISKLFKNRRPQISRPKPNFSADKKEEETLAVAESQRRRKRQVSNGYSEFGARTSSSSQQSRRQPQYFDQLENPPFTAFSQQHLNEAQLQYQSPNPKRSTSLNKDPYFANNENLYSSSTNSGSATAATVNKKSNSNTEAVSGSSSSTTTSRRQVRQNSDDSVKDQRSRSRFNGAGRQPLRSRQTVAEVATTTTTTTSRPALRSRFRPKTVTSNSNVRSKNQFSENPSTPNRFSSTNRRPSTSLFDYDENEDDYDYNVELESSQNAVPDFITVTHVVPIVTTINLGNTVKDVISTTASLEIVAATDLKSTNIDGSPVIYANAHTATPALGTQVVTFDALRATETTAVVFTPTRIRGLRTSFSHAVPSTIYNIRSVTTSIVDPVDQNQLLTQLLLKFLSGQQQTPQLPNLLQQNPAVPATQYITHTSTTATTVTNIKSKILTLTLRGRDFKTTLVESSTEVVTLTELSTETKIAPTAAGLGGGSPILATANPLDSLQGLLGGGGGDLQQQLLLAQLQQQLQQQALGQQHVLTQPSLGSLPQQLNLIQPSPIEQTAPPPSATAEPEPPAPKTSVVTVFVSGKSPDEFTRLTSTVIVEEPPKKEGESEKSRKKRSPQNIQNLLDINPTQTQTSTNDQTSSSSNLGFLLQLPELPFDIFPRNGFPSANRNSRVSYTNSRYTLFPQVFNTQEVQ